MAKYKIVDYLESELSSIFQDEYGNRLSLKDINKETGLPLFILNELKECGYVNEKDMDSNGLLILNTMRYCYNNHRFLKSALGQLSVRDKYRLLRPKRDTKLKFWIKTRVFNLKDNGNIVSIANIYSEVCKHFPSIEEQGYRGYKDVKRYVNNARQAYLRNMTKLHKK